MEIKFQVPEIFLQLQEVRDETGSLERNRDMLQNIMNKCNTYSDVLRMEKEGLLSMDGLLEIMRNYEEILGISTSSKSFFDTIKEELEKVPRAQKRVRKAI